MPTSSASRQSRLGASSNKRSYWPNAGPKGNQSKTTNQQECERAQPIGDTNGKSGAANRASRPAKYKQIRHISPPCSLSPAAGARDQMAGEVEPSNASSSPASAEQELMSLAIGGQTVFTGKQPASIGSLAGEASLYGQSKRSATGGKTNFLVSNAQFARSVNLSQQSRSQASLDQPQTSNSSTAQLHNLTGSPLSIRRSANLKCIKTLIIGLLAIDLLITVFVHQFSSEDQMSIWFTSHKMRFSLLNLILSSVWFVVLVGAILFDIYFILVISCLVDLLSFLLLLVLSVRHFTLRVDYNSVSLTSLLALLFSIVLLHVYLVVMSVLTINLTLAVKRRQERLGPK